MKICLVRPPVFDPDFRPYPLNIEYIYASLKKDKHDVSFVDAGRIAGKEINKKTSEKISGLAKNVIQSKNQIICENIEMIDSLFQDENHYLWKDIAGQIVATEPDIIGFSCYTESLSSTRVIIDTIRNHFNLKVPVILGGIHPTVAPIETMERLPGVDFLVCGEGEIVVRDLVKAIERKDENLEEIKGIAYRKNGEIKINPKPGLIPDLADLPVLDFHFALPDHSFVILTSRGCPFNCNFCSSKHIWTKKVRYRPTDHVVREMTNLIEKIPVDSLRFGDDTFTLNKKHMIGIAEGMKREGIRLKLSIGSRIDTIDKEKLNILKAMGVEHISFGVETGSKKIMKLIKKDVNTEEVVSKVKMVNNEGIKSTTYFIINHPEETKEDMMDSFELIKKLVKECKLNVVRLNSGFPYPGTEWWEYANDKNLVSNISFHKKPTTYNHLGPSVVNMTSESMDTLVEVKKSIDRFLTKSRWRRKIKNVIKDPSILVRKITSIRS
ncbi:MAG: B12-binding domain-containing radical SAM protein [bacterium]|nr:B12-binding domain-containing radical SAM protein [bacterium]